MIEPRQPGGVEQSVSSGAPHTRGRAATTVWRRVLLTGRTRELGIFGLIGVASTVVHLGLFAVLRSLLDTSQVANAVALLTATVLNTAANRRLTFGVTGRDGVVRQQVQGLIVFALTMGMTSGALALLHSVSAHPVRWVETLTVAVATLAATAVKYLAMRRWMFSPDADLA